MVPSDRRPSRLSGQTARARIAWANDRAAERFLGEVVARVQRNYNPLWHVWVYSRRQRDNKCSALADYSISYKHCDRLYSYICERGKTTGDDDDVGIRQNRCRKFFRK